MKVREQAISELSHMKTTELLRVYNLILVLKNQGEKIKPQKSTSAYLRAREALKNCRGPLAEDIIMDREERIWGVGTVRRSVDL